MQVVLLRHGLTHYNAEKRYQGQRDIPLSREGLEQLHRADFDPPVVYVSPLQRARQTAAVLFPKARQVAVRDLQEMNFGTLEGEPYRVMERDPEFYAWLEKNDHSEHPDGERRADFRARTCAAFAALMDRAVQEEQPMLVVVAHGGTLMSLMDRFAVPHKPYEEWCAPNGGGYVLDAREWACDHALHLVRTVCYAQTLH